MRMDKLNRITLLDDSKRPETPKIENLSTAQRQQGSGGLRKVVERRAGEHLVIQELLDELEAGSSAALQTSTPEAYATLRATFKTLDTCVRSHFGYEETELEDALGVIDVGL
jgi:hypothetical protein